MVFAALWATPAVGGSEPESYDLRFSANGRGNRPPQPTSSAGLPAQPAPTCVGDCHKDRESSRHHVGNLPMHWASNCTTRAL